MPTRHSPAARLVSALLLALSLSVVATGCLTGDIGVKVNKDGSGEVIVELYPSDDLQKTLTSSNAAEAAKSAVEKIDDATFERKLTDGRVNYKIKIPFDHYKDLDALSTSVTFLNGRQVRLFESFDLSEPEDGKWRLNAKLAPELNSKDFLSGESIETLMETEGKTALQNDLRLTIALPGRIIRSNATEVKGGKGVWHLRTEKKDMTVVMFTEPKPLLTFVQKVLIGSGLAVVVGFVLVVWGAQHSWGHKDIEKGRRKKMRFPGSQANDAGWVPDAAAAGTSGGRGFADLPVAAGGASGPPAPAPVTDAPPVAPPEAPYVDPNVPNPFAPHVPGQPTLVHDVPDVDQLIHKAEEATLDHIAHYGEVDPANELHSLEHKAEEAIPDHRAFPVSPEHEMHSLEHKAEAAVHEEPQWAPTAPDPAAPLAPAPAAEFEQPVAPQNVVEEYPDVTADDVELPEADPKAALAAYPDISGDESDQLVSDSAAPQVGDDDSVPADWYPDPDDESRMRWWDGQNWTDYVN